MLVIDITSGVWLQYLAEGAANIVYMINPRPPSPSTAADAELEDYEHPPSEITAPPMDPALDGKLVRLRKATSSGVTVGETYQHYENAIVPLFTRKEDLIEHILFSPTRALLESLNTQLKAMEAHADRPRTRHGTYLAEDENHGLLITDMSGSNLSNAAYRCLEFKPKWLVQSPTAPIDAVRCRTCALRNLRRCWNHKDSNRENNCEFCPLGLVSKEKAVVKKTVETIFKLTPGLGEADDETLLRYLTDYIYLNPLLERLSAIQQSLDPLGVVNSKDSATTQNLAVAMTLRDCTLFLKVSEIRISHLDMSVDVPSHQLPTNNRGEIETRLGDLDFKSPSNGKKEYWSSIESELVDSGWYTGRENVEVEVDELCILSKNL